MADSKGRTTGKQGSFSLSGTTIALTKWTPKVTRKLADTTDSSDYDSASDMVYDTQLPVRLSQDLSVEGRYRISQTPTAIVAQLYSGVSALPVILKTDAATTFGHGNYDLSDFTCDNPVDDTVTFTATLKGNGVFTPGS